MFGKPEWFVPKRFGWGLTPITWQGWAYAIAWVAVIAAPFVVLLIGRGVFEAMIWMVVMVGFLFMDVHMILRSMKRLEEEKEVFRIMDDEETRHDEAKTAKFEMRVADRGKA